MPSLISIEFDDWSIQPWDGDYETLDEMFTGALIIGAVPEGFEIRQTGLLAAVFSLENSLHLASFYGWENWHATDNYSRLFEIKVAGAGLRLEWFGGSLDCDTGQLLRQTGEAVLNLLERIRSQAPDIYYDHRFALDRPDIHRAKLALQVRSPDLSRKHEVIMEIPE